MSAFDSAKVSRALANRYYKYVIITDIRDGEYMRDPRSMLNVGGYQVRCIFIAVILVEKTGLFSILVTECHCFVDGYGMRDPRGIYLGVGGVLEVRFRLSESLRYIMHKKETSCDIFSVFPLLRAPRREGLRLAIKRV